MSFPFQRNRLQVLGGSVFGNTCLVNMCLVGIILNFVVRVHSAPVEKEDFAKATGNGEPVWSHGESYAFANAAGEGAVIETDSWSAVDNHGGLHVNNITSDGNVIGYQVSGMTNCSQESYAFASGSLSANAVAYGLCNSSVLLDQPVSNTGYGL